MADQATEKTSIASDAKLQQIAEQLRSANLLAYDAIQGNKEISAAAKEDANKIANAASQKAAAHPAPKGWWNNLLGHNKWMKKEAQRASKLAKLGAGKVMDFAKAGAKKVEHFAKNILDLLLKGLGLAALWLLFKWMSTADWEKIYKDAKEWIEKILESWDTITEAWKAIWAILKPLVGWYYLKWILQGLDGKGGLKGLFGKDGRFHKMWKAFTKLKIWKWFGTKGMLGSLLDDLKKVFGEKSTIGRALKDFKKWAKLKLFNFSSPFRTLLRHIKNIFGANGSIARWLKDIKKMAITKMFGPQSAIGRKIKWIKDIFGAEGSIARWLKDAKKATFGKWFGPQSKFQGILKTIKGWFGEGSFIGKVIKDIKKTTVFKSLFGPNSALVKLTTWIGSFFGGAGGKAASGGLKGAFKAITGSPALAGVKKFLTGIGAKFLRFLGPVVWIMAAYDAIAGEGGFMDEFNKDTGSLWDKTIAGLAGAAKRLMDFFVFDLMGLFEDGVKWAMKKVLGIFGYSEKEVEGQDWYKFSVTEYLRGVFSDYIDLVKAFWTFDGPGMLVALKKLWGKAASFIDWVFDLIVRKPINWLAEKLGFSEELISEDFSLSKWIEEEIIDPIWKVLKGIFEFDYMKFIKESTVLSWLARKSGFLPPTKEEAAAELKELNATIKEQKEELAEGDKKTWRGQDRALLLKQAEAEKAKLLAAIKRGEISKVPESKTIPAVENGGGGQGTGVNVNQQNIDAKQSGYSSYVMASNPNNPAKAKHQLSRFASSDIRLKENIQIIEEGKDDNPNIYSFNYKGDKNTKWKGVMAQELIGTKYSDAVITDAEGFYMVDYTRLGFPMVKISE